MSDRHNIKGYSQRLQDRAHAQKYAARFERGSRKRIDEREQRAVRKIFAGLTDCHSVLDIPCGAGRFLSSLGQGGRRVLEVDVAFEVLLFAREKVTESGVKAWVMQGDASGLPLPDGAVDCVFSNRLLHHILAPAERVALLREFHRVCRRWVVVSFFNYQGLGTLRRLLKRLKGRTPSYQQQPTLEEFSAETLHAGFRVSRVVSTGLPWVSQKYFVLEKA